MNHIKQLIDRVTLVERNGQQNVVIPINEARLLRDELTKLLLDMTGKPNMDVIRVEMTGGKW